MSQTEVVMVLMIIGCLVTVACSLMSVWHFRRACQIRQSRIANSEQPVEPVRVFEYRLSEKRHTISDKKVSESAKKSSKTKGFSAKAANKPKQRKTVTVKKRVTK